MSIVHSYRDIAKAANLRALDGRPQTEDSAGLGKPVEMPCDSNPQEDWQMWSGMYGYTAPKSDGA